MSSDPLPVPVLDSQSDAQASQIQAQLDVVYAQLLKLSNGCLNTQNVIFIVSQLVQDCDNFNVPDGSKAKVILAAIDRFCVEHAQDKAIFSFVEPVVRFAVLVANGTITINVRAIEQDVDQAASSCLSCLPFGKSK